MCVLPKKGRPQGNIVEKEIRLFSKKACKTKKPVFLTAKIKYAHMNNQFNSFDTDQKSIRKSNKVSFSLKKLNSLRISLVLLGGP